MTEVTKEFVQKNEDEKIIEIEIERLRSFKNHPFQVKDDNEMHLLKESIEKYGILTPLIVRPVPDGVYEIIAGHRRRHAAELLGYRKVPVIIRVMNEDEAILNMVDSNLHREKISFSEKAFAYKMKNDVLKRKSGRKKGQIDHKTKKKRTVEIISEECGDSPKQVQRYISLTKLIPEFLQKLDDELISFNPAVEISALKEEEQKQLLLRNCFEQAIKWEMIEKNPCTYATVPKHKSQKREIWTAETLMYAMDVCEDERLKLAINLSFSCSLRLGELLGLTWDCVDISPEAIEENRAYVYINKETQRVTKETLKNLEGKDVLLVFPSQHKTNKTVQILKTPKTESSIRKVFLPKSVANMLVEWKAEQDEVKEVLGEEYIDYNLVMATTFGNPIGTGAIRGQLNKLIEEYNLPPVVFHSLRHSSVTYKLKLNGGDIKAVQGDSGHSQVDMVTDVYSHIIDEDRRRNAELFEEAFYEKKNLDPKMRDETATQTVDVPDDVDAELLAKVLANPEMKALLASLAKAMK